MYSREAPARISNFTAVNSWSEFPNIDWNMVPEQETFVSSFNLDR